MRIKWLIAQYGLGDNITHIGLPASAKSKLLNMAPKAIDNDELVGIYIPLKTEPQYNVNPLQGYVVGTVMLESMPNNKSIEDYSYNDVDGTLRWPIGWPCRLIGKPQNPIFLKHIVERVHGIGKFPAYTAQFLHGPVSICKEIENALSQNEEYF